jgi:HK97 family phage prohead protease
VVVTRWVRVSVAPAGRETARARSERAHQPDGDGNPVVLTFAASTETEDRAGDVVVASGWDLEAFRRNPVFLWAHRHDEPPIGRVIDVHVDGKSLVATVEFAPTPFAQEVATLYRGGYLSGVSVGFRALELERRRSANGRPATLFLRQELLEISAAPVPLNAEALVSTTSVGSGFQPDRNVAQGPIDDPDVARGLVPRLEDPTESRGDAESEELGLVADVARLWQGVAELV